MKVSLVSEHASPLALIGGVDAGGQNVHVASLAVALAVQGDEVVVHTRRDDPYLPRRVPFAPGVTVDHVDAGPARQVPKDQLLAHMPEFAADLGRVWERAQPDVVHAHFWMSGLASVRAARPHRLPVVLTYHAHGREKRLHQGGADGSPAQRLTTEAWLARTVQHVIATTDEERRKLVALGAAPAAVSVVPCGVDLGTYRPGGPAAGRSDGQPGPPRVVCLSRLVPRKGIAEVIAAVARLDGVELVIAGGPPEPELSSDPYAGELRTMIDELGLSDRARLVGAVARPDVPALLHSASIVCCTPWYEPFGIVALEAMACGVPVVATRVGGLAETVVDGVTGRLVEPRDPDAIGTAIAELLARPDLRSSMSAAALTRVQRYGWPAVADRTRTVYDALRHASSAPSTTFVSSGVA
jgi:glycosyltransferase involved in cell wall biosynthesis